MGGGGSTTHQPNALRVSSGTAGTGMAPPAPPAADPAGPRTLTDAPFRLYRSDEIDLHMPAVTDVREGLAEGPVSCEIDALVRSPGPRPGMVRGWVDVAGRGRQATLSNPRLTCTCGAAAGEVCAHQRIAQAELTDRLRAQQIRTPERAAMRTVLGELGADLRASQSAQSQATSSWPESEVSYSEDPAAFQSAYREAQDRRRRGEPPVPFMVENATGGLGARGTGRGFGVEIEFDFEPGVNQSAAMASIGQDMRAAGVARSAQQGGYHSAQRQGYTDAANAWQLESDCTVAGEIVSPILYDEPQSWRNLATVCDIVKRHGGRATVRTGGHVHVSAHNYDHTVANHSRLMSLFRGYQDTLYRLAQNPGASRHRGVSWCRPNNVPATGYRSIDDARAYNSGHNWGMNLQSVAGRASDHVEFRMWDGSLDPAVIQTQVKLSLGMTEAAFRGSTEPAFTSTETVGEHRTRNSGLPRGQRLRGESWRSDTASFRSLADTIFHRAADKAQAASLFAVTRWQR